MKVFVSFQPRQELFPMRAGFLLTWIGQRNHWCIVIPKSFPKGRHNSQYDWAKRSDGDGVQDSGLFVGGPANVAERSGPEVGDRHCKKAIDFRGMY